MSGRLIYALAAALLAYVPYAAAAQNFPERPVRIVLGFPPGGGVDLVARILVPRLSEYLGQQVIVDNRPGASGLIGTEVAAKSAADGHTLFFGTAGNLSINQSLYPKLHFDIERAFAPVTLVSSVPFLVYVHPSLPATTVRDFIALAKARPGQIRFYSSGNGGLPHLAGELFNSAAQVHTVHVPYKGAAPGITALITGEVQLGFGALAVGQAYVKAGRLRALATTSAKRIAALPDVPALGETLPGFEVVNWYGMVVPSGTPKPAIMQLNADLNRAMKSPDIAEKLAAQGTEPAGTSPEAFGMFMRSEAAKWAKVIRAGNIRAD
jgi:tripartite-type tricarboxylate transporter receptor subunit TctC